MRTRNRKMKTRLHEYLDGVLMGTVFATVICMLVAAVTEDHPAWTAALFFAEAVFLGGVLIHRCVRTWQSEKAVRRWL